MESGSNFDSLLSEGKTEGDNHHQRSPGDPNTGSSGGLLDGLIWDDSAAAFYPEEYYHHHQYGLHAASTSSSSTASGLYQGDYETTYGQPGYSGTSAQMDMHQEYQSLSGAASSAYSMESSGSRMRYGQDHSYNGSSGSNNIRTEQNQQEQQHYWTPSIARRTSGTSYATGVQREQSSSYNKHQVSQCLQHTSYHQQETPSQAAEGHTQHLNQLEYDHSGSWFCRICEAPYTPSNVVNKFCFPFWSVFKCEHRNVNCCTKCHAKYCLVCILMLSIMYSNQLDPIDKSKL